VDVAGSFAGRDKEVHKIGGDGGMGVIGLMRELGVMGGD
jgi:hypothetical protein